MAQDSTARSDSQGRVYVEEAFVDCWADLMMGGGWLDREELTFKEANWAIVSHPRLLLFLTECVLVDRVQSLPESSRNTSP